MVMMMMMMLMTMLMMMMMMLIVIMVMTKVMMLMIFIGILLGEESGRSICHCKSQVSGTGTNYENCAHVAVVHVWDLSARSVRLGVQKLVVVWVQPLGTSHEDFWPKTQTPCQILITAVAGFLETNYIIQVVSLSGLHP